MNGCLKFAIFADGMKRLIIILFLGLYVCLSFQANASQAVHENCHTERNVQVLCKKTDTYALAAKELGSLFANLGQNLQFHVRLQISQQLYQQRLTVKTISNLFARNIRSVVAVFDGKALLYTHSRHKYYIYALRKIVI